MTYEEKIFKCETLDTLFSFWKQKKVSEITYESDGNVVTKSLDHSKNIFVSDGIVNPNKWGNYGNKKILFVMKEAYGGDGDWSLADWLLNEHPTLRIWKRIAKWSHGLQYTTSNCICRYMENLSELVHNEALERIAVMNLKKSDGKSSSQYAEIAAYANLDSLEIRKEFELIDAEIIICGATFNMLCSALLGNPLPEDEKSDNWYYFLNIFGKKRLFIDYYHPANRWSDLLNYYGILSIYQQALIEDNEQGK